MVLHKLLFLTSVAVLRHKEASGVCNVVQGEESSSKTNVNHCFWKLIVIN